MKQVWKFVLTPQCPTIEMPEGAKVLCTASQRDAICLWVEVDPANPKVARTFDVFGTGHEIPAAVREYIGTVHVYDGLVFHVYERWTKVSQ